jgi:hypothetical protein
MYTITNLVLFNLSILVLVFLFYKIRKYDYFKIIFLSIIISFYFGVRPLNIGADTLAYHSVFINNSGISEVGFLFLTRTIFNIFGDNYQIYFFLINFLMITHLISGFKLIIKNPIYIFSAWIIVSLPYSVLMQINIIRQGLGLSFFIFGLSLILNKKYLFGSIYFLLSFTLHLSMLIYIGLFLITFFTYYKKYTRLILLVFSFLIALSGISLNMVNLFGSDYLTQRLLLDIRPIDDFFFFFSKIFFYIGFFFIVDFLMIAESFFIQKRINLLYFIILTSGIIFLENELYSTRFLIALDFLLIPMFLLKSSIYKNKVHSILIFSLIFLVFLLSLNTSGFKLNFNY